MDKVFFETEIEKALAILRAGGIILYPTDTVWGIGCDARNENAVQKIFDLKKRQESKSRIVLVADEREVLQYTASPDLAVFDFIEQQTRPTTVIFDGAIGFPDNLVAADGSVAIRIVQDEFCRHLIKRLRNPIVSTSANISGEPAPKAFKEISEKIKNGVDHIVQWRQDDESFATPSQLIKWQNGQAIFFRK
jgi:L-threonylcarbamoyladenylate synthase